MKQAIFDPSIMCISDADWLAESKKDQFLLHLQENLKMINRYRIVQIAWNENLESCFWQNPQPPWRHDKDWNNKMVPWLYWNLKKNTFDVDFNNNLCSVTPQMSCCNSNAFSCFLRLAHEMNRRYSEYYLCLGLDNKLPKPAKYHFHCTCCSKNHSPIVIRSANEWLNHIDLEKYYWPQDIADTNILIDGLKIVQARDFNNVNFQGNDPP